MTIWSQGSCLGTDYRWHNLLLWLQPESCWGKRKKQRICESPLWWKQGFALSGMDENGRLLGRARGAEVLNACFLEALFVL